jgi:tRNA A-37 threonylcarbamoyl transferase component Bud32
MTFPRRPSDCPNIPGIDVAGVFRRLADGATVDDLLREYPGLRPDDLRACFAYAAEVVAPAAADVETGKWALASEAEPAAGLPTTSDATVSPPATVAPAVPAKRVSIPGYEVLGKLGEGGMGVVYKARHLRLNRIVALKMILAGEHASEDMVGRFALEAEAVAQLQHPGIVQIYEIGEHDGHSFLALEYVAGGSLAARLDDKPWPAEKAAELVETLARSIQTAHDRGIVHRDLKPENVLLADAPDTPVAQLTPKITDFGLAKRLQDGTGRTRTGEVMGTPSYMAPEQAAGKKNIGPAADVYALGALLYRLLAGRPPFQADTPLHTLVMVLEQEPAPLRTLNKSVPRELETIALKCLAKEPQKRYASAVELADDLRRFLDGEPIKARRLSARRRLVRWCRQRPGAAAARGTVGLIIIILVSLLFLINNLLLLAAGLAWVFSSLLSFWAVSRTKLRPFLIALSVSLLLTIPVWSLLRTCLVPLLLLPALAWANVALFLLVAIAPVYYGIVCRIVRWYCDGDLIDTVVGSVLGTVVGGSLASIWAYLVEFLYAGRGPRGIWWIMDISWISLVVICVLGLGAGPIIGAYIGAMSGRKASRRGHV